MLKQIWIAECDLCWKVERAKVERAKENISNAGTIYMLPYGWAWGISDIKCAVCPECIRERRRLIDD